MNTKQNALCFSGLDHFNQFTCWIRPSHWLTAEVKSDCPYWFTYACVIHDWNYACQGKWFHLHVSCRSQAKIYVSENRFSSWAKPLSSLQATRTMLSRLVLLSTYTSPASQGQRWTDWLLHPKQYNIIVSTISHTHTHEGEQRRTFHNSKEPGGANILRKQHSLPGKLSQADGCSGW